MIEMIGVREYSEEMRVRLDIVGDRLVIYALNECGFNSTKVDLLDVLAWVKANRPELLND
jgi:hypothetical protein